MPFCVNACEEHEPYSTPGGVVLAGAVAAAGQMTHKPAVLLLLAVAHSFAPELAVPYDRRYTHGQLAVPGVHLLP